MPRYKKQKKTFVVKCQMTLNFTPQEIIKENKVAIKIIWEFVFCYISIYKENWTKKDRFETNLGDLPKEIVQLIIRHFGATSKKTHGIQCFILDETRMKDDKGAVRYGNPYIVRSVGGIGVVSCVNTSPFKIIDTISNNSIESFHIDLMSHEIPILNGKTSLLSKVDIDMDEMINGQPMTTERIDDILSTITESGTSIHLQMAFLKPKFCNLLKIWENRSAILDHNNWEIIDNIKTPQRYKKNLVEYANTTDVVMILKINHYVGKIKDLLLREHSTEQMVNALRLCILEWSKEPYSKNPFTPLYTRLRYSLHYTCIEIHVKNQKILCPTKKIENKYEKVIKNDSLIWRKVLSEKKENRFLMASKMHIPIVTNPVILIEIDTPLTQLRCTRYINKNRYFFVYKLQDITLQLVVALGLLMGMFSLIIGFDITK